MSVLLSPNRNLGFRRPLTQVVKRSLTITNQNSQPVAFKVKTTAPKLYCVRPNSGRVEPGESVDVSVMLQPLKEEPPLNSKCKDKFLVQSTLITPEKETMALHDLWLAPDMNEEGVVHQQKLRVLYLPAEEGPLEEEDENPVVNRNEPQGVSDFVFTPPSPVPPVEDNFSRENSNEYHDEESHEVPPVPPQQPQPQSREVPILDAPAHELQSPQSYQPIREEHVEPTPFPAHQPIHVPPPSASEIVYVENPLNEELFAKYKDAQAEIERLRANIEALSVAPTSELRSRRNRTISDAGSTAETDVHTVIDEPYYHHQDGVPLQVVAIVALGVFITTYLFF
ncbi:hypothetical protein AN958_07753 [Leucoagaricus sp. SymC.cos]|nr:hypothetical protein AN958_07753 [Leucoagaricus sp. SymC.cos]